MTLDIADTHAERMALGLLGGLASFLTDNLADSFFPDDGPFARALYPKHMEAIELTQLHDVVSVFGGNRCFTPWSQLETGRATRQALELIDAGVIDVRSWDGSSRCTKRAEAPYLKALAPAFRVVLDNGSVFKATRKHRVLTVEGWTSLDRLVQRASGLHCTRIPQGSPASCDTARSRYGSPLRVDQAGAPGVAASQAGAPARGRRDLPPGAAAHTPRHSRAYPEFVLPATQHDPGRIAALCARFEAPTPIYGAARYSLIRRALQRLRDESAPQTAVIEAVRDLLGGTGSGFQPEWSDAGHLPNSGELYVAWDHPQLCGGNRIVAIEGIGYQPIFDVTVEGTSCYESGGVIHHNSGKTNLLAYILSCWAQGTYPHWWHGRVFQKPTRLWACSQTSALVTAGLQRYLIGAEGKGGLIRGENILHVDWAPNTLGMAQRVLVRHVPTGLGSELFFKTYDMGWRRFQSDTIDAAALDEEPPAMIYSEALTRSATTNGVTLLGFTALQGVTPLVAHLLPQYAGVEGETPDDEEPAKRAHVFIGWADIPYSQLSKSKRESLAKGYLPHERQARMAGIPQMGTGLVYPVPEEQFVVEAFIPPRHWPKIAAGDPGGTPKGDGRTAALWCAYDADSDCLYAYSEYYEKFAPIPSHVHAFAKRGNWVPMALDPAGANITDGKAVFAEYANTMRELNADWPVLKADKRFSLGRAELFDRMTSGRFKVMSTLRNTLSEHRSYIIKENGTFVGAHHLLDCARYICRSVGHAALPPALSRPMKIPERTYF